MKLNVSRLAGCLLAILVLGGCAATSFSRTGTRTVSPREATCEFAVYTMPPSSHFDELGSIKFNPGPSFHTFTVDQTKQTAQKDVCSAGGNGLILAPIGKDGYYETGTVIQIEK